MKSKLAALFAVVFFLSTIHGSALAQTSTLPISSLPTAAPLTGSEYVPLVQSGATRKALTSAIANLSGGEVDTNADLKALSISGKLAGYGIYRKGFYAPFDGGGQQYFLSLSACPIGSAGNDFTQVAPNSGTGCWLAAPARAEGYDVRAAGMRAGDSGSYSSPNSEALRKVFAEPSGPSVVIPEGITFRLACGQFSATAGVSFLGAGNGSGALKFDSGCAFTGDDVFAWNGVSHVSLRNFTLDLNTPSIPASIISVFGCKAYAGDMNSCVFEALRVVNGVTKMFLLSGAANSGHSLKWFVVKDSYLQMAPATSQNQCVLMTTNDGAGYIPDAIIERNTCVGSGIQTDGARTRITDNDVSGFQFGSGIFTAYGASTPTNTDCIIAGNNIHDTGPGLDVNAAAHLGLENNCFNSLVSDNTFNNLGGAAILNYTSLAQYVANKARGVGKGYDGNPVNRSAYVAAFGTVPDATSARTVWIGNGAVDDGASDGGTPDTPAMLYGFYVGPGVAGVVEGRDNQVDISAKANAGFLLAARFGRHADASANVDRQLINFSQSAESLLTTTPNFSFGPLDVASFKHWWLNCRNVFPASADIIQIQVSQDGASTWKTSGSYVSSGVDWKNGVASGYVLVAATGMQIGNSSWDHTQVVHGQFQMHCRDIGSSVSRHACSAFDVSARESATGSFIQTTAGGYWNGDSSPINGLRVNTAGGANISGSCTLRGEI